MEEQITLQVIEEQITEINELAKLLNPEFVYFKDAHQTLRFDKTEAAFFNNIDYYYILFIERGDVFSKFIEEKLLLYELDYKNVTSYLEMIHDLRTYKSHRIDMETQRGQNIAKHVKKWYFEQVANKNPSADEKILCIPRLNEMAYLILTNIHKCLERINNDSRRSFLICEMQITKEKHLPDYVIIQVAEGIIENMQVQIDAYKFVKQFGSQIKKKMGLYVNDSKKKRTENLKLCIEDVLMRNKIGLCPLSYDQIKKIYQNRTAKELGDLKRRAGQISDDNMFLTDEEILQMLLIETPLNED